MPKQNVPKYTNQSVSHHNISFNLKRPRAIDIDKKIDKIRAKLEIDRRKVYSDKVTAKILNGEKNWYVPKNTATRGDVLEIVVNYYLDHVE